MSLVHKYYNRNNNVLHFYCVFHSRTNCEKERTWVVYFAYEDPISMSQIQEVLTQQHKLMQDCTIFCTGSAPALDLCQGH